MHSRRTYHRIRTLVCTAGIVLLAIPPAAQGQPNPVGEQQPVAIGGIRYDSQRGVFGRQFVGSVSLSPLLIPLSVGRNNYTRGSFLDVAAGIRFRSDGTSDIRWRFSVLDVDAGRHDEKIDWVLDNPGDSGTPLLRETRLGSRMGLTLLDYNTISTPELDARWIEGRAGGGIDLPIGDRAALDITVEGAGELVSLRPGMEGYPELGDAAGELIFGGQAGADVAIELRYLPWKHLLGFLVVDARERTLFADPLLHRLTFGGGINILLRTLTPHWGTGRPTHGEGIVLFLRFEREQAFLGDRSQLIDRVQAGIQYGMGYY